MKASDPGPIKNEKERAELQQKYGKIVDDGMDYLQKAIDIDPEYDSHDLPEPSASQKGGSRGFSRRRQSRLGTGREVVQQVARYQEDEGRSASKENHLTFSPFELERGAGP